MSKCPECGEPIPCSGFHPAVPKAFTLPQASGTVVYDSPVVVSQEQRTPSEMRDVARTRFLGLRAVNRERFMRIAENRTNAVIERLRILGNCSNRGAYEYTPADVKRIFEEITRAAESTRRQFERTASRPRFKLEASPAVEE